MIILRLPPFPLQVQYQLPMPNTDYLFTIENAPRTIEASEVITTDEHGILTYVLTGDFIRFDHDYSVSIYEINNDPEEHIMVQDILNIVRPYVDPKTLGTTATEIAQYEEWERLARAVIDSIVPGGFIFEKNVLQVVGQGTDYVPLWETVYAIDQVYENDVLVYDSTQNPPALGDYNYTVTKDRSAIIKVPTFAPTNEAWNRSEKKPTKYRFASSDSVYAYSPADNPYLETNNNAVSFPEGYDYVFIYQAGYKVIPHPIRDAVTRLIEDIKCGKMEHYTRYITRYQTDQFTVEYDPTKFFGTGNILVDTVLQKYITTLATPGIL
jgi:hypothetical protein